MWRARANQRLLLVLVFVVMALYWLSGTSDRMDGLTVKQQAAVVSTWDE